VNDAPESGPSEAEQQWLRLLGKQVRRTRRDLELTQVTVAQRAGIRPNTLIDLEQGRTSPNMLTLLRVARALGVPVHQLLP
jgi:transcriptional regulator with XRE-family HTH domain